MRGEDAAEADASVAAEGGTPLWFPLRGRELLLIFVFWGFVAALSVAGRLLDPRIPNVPGVVTRGVIALTVAEYAVWAVLTGPIFWVTSRFSIEGGRRAGRLLLFIVLGVVAAMVVDTVLDLVRANVFPFPQRPFGRRGGRPPFALGQGILRLRFLDDLLVYLAVVAGGMARDYFLRYRARLEEAATLRARAARLEAQLAEARLSVLRTQLNPHFLFNTLHAISALVERDPRGVRRMISRLSELLRATLDGSTEQEVPLEEELDLLGRYIEIMQIRHQGRIEVRMDIDPAVRDALVPNLVLQPLVENAFQHGAGQKVEGLATIELRARREGASLVLAVRDNGPGPAAAAAPDDSRDGGGGLGLRNTRARLEQLYGAE
ncbi:MAG TPA: histidine kinase, partial [Gemmatimonadaceae bacterium]|nr:histidine kinase [Gemmatimonadaceae bacterium]